MEYLVLEGEGSVDSMTLLHMAATLERKLSQKAAQEFLETLVLDNWLHEVPAHLIYHHCAHVYLNLYLSNFLKE